MVLIVLATMPSSAEPHSAPDWMEDAIVYQVFVRAFTDDGSIEALTDRLPELVDLGVNTLYLMPIHPTGRVARIGSLGSPYSIRDHYAIEPSLGTKEDFRALVDAAHQHGMRVIMDLVINHTAHDHVLVETHPEWFSRSSDGTFKHPHPEWKDVIDLDYGNPQLRAYMIGMARYWVQTFDIDGFRADASYLVPVDFWLQLRKELEAVKPDLLYLSESDTPGMLSAFDLVYNWTIGRRVQDVGRGTALPGQLLQWTQWETHLNYLENHDQPRIAALAAGRSTKPLAAFLLTIPGVPLIQNGQEIGAVDRLSLFDPAKINWDMGDYSLRDFYRKLIEIRTNRQELRTGKLTPVDNSLSSFVLSYLREDSAGSTLVLINFTPIEQEVLLDHGAVVSNASYVDLLTGNPVRFVVDSEHVRAHLDPFESLIIPIE